MHIHTVSHHRFQRRHFRREYDVHRFESYTFNSLAYSLLFPVTSCLSQCGTNSLCTGNISVANPVFSCSCLPGDTSPTGNGKNCIAKCTSNAGCGTNANCNVGTGVCTCNAGYFSPKSDGTACTVQAFPGMLQALGYRAIFIHVYQHALVFSALSRIQASSTRPGLLCLRN